MAFQPLADTSFNPDASHSSAWKQLLPVADRPVAALQSSSLSLLRLLDAPRLVE